VKEIVGFLWRTSLHLAYDLAYKRWPEKPLDPVAFEQVADGLGGAGDPQMDDGVALDPDEVRRQAVEMARQLLPTLGSLNLQNAMRLLIDAVEARDVEFSANDAAEILGTKPNIVRAWWSRGFDRLTTRAQGLGVRILRSRFINSEEEGSDQSAGTP
jgi:hypothetical protein